MTLWGRMRRSILSRAVYGAVGVGATLLLLPGLALAQQDQTQDAPVLLELYTAQGCASCPPADDMLINLAGRDDVIALALHVDYWDYIGWADTFADRAYTERQQRYARRFGHSTIYTPQVVINGTQIVEGFRVLQVMDAIQAEHQRPPEVVLHLARTEGGIAIRAEPTAEAAPQIAMATRRSAQAALAGNSVVGTLSMRAQSEAGESAATDQPAVSGSVSLAANSPAATASAAAPAAAEPSPAPVGPPARLGPVGSGPYTLQLVRYRPLDTVEILDGENAGLSANYANIVTSWQTIGSWDMLAPLDLTVPIEGDAPVVVLVQESGQGEILAAARLR